MKPSSHVATSLAATIQAARPELLVTSLGAGKPIPAEMPADFLRKPYANIEDIGEPTTACFFTLSKVQPKGWLCYSEIAYPAYNANSMY